MSRNKHFRSKDLKSISPFSVLQGLYLSSNQVSVFRHLLPSSRLKQNKFPVEVYGSFHIHKFPAGHGWCARIATEQSLNITLPSSPFKVGCMSSLIWLVLNLNEFQMVTYLQVANPAAPRWSLWSVTGPFSCHKSEVQQAVLEHCGTKRI